MLPDDIFVFFFINGIRVTMCEHLRAASCTAGEAGKGILYKIQIETSEKQKKRSIIFIWSITVLPMTPNNARRWSKVENSRKKQRPMKIIKMDEKIHFFVYGIEIEVFSSESGLVRSESIFCVCFIRLRIIFDWIIILHFYALKIVLVFPPFLLPSSLLVAVDWVWYTDTCNACVFSSSLLYCVVVERNCYTYSHL